MGSASCSEAPLAIYLLLGRQPAVFLCRKEHWKLLGNLKTTVEGLVSTSNPNVWSKYGGLERLCRDMHSILYHGLIHDKVGVSCQPCCPAAALVALTAYITSSVAVRETCASVLSIPCTSDTVLLSIRALCEERPLFRPAAACSEAIKLNLP